jgi:2-keto-4-pentenoate hydratase
MRILPIFSPARTIGLAALLALSATSSPARAACPDEARVSAAAAAFFAVKPVESYGPSLTVPDAYCAQKQYVALLERKLGPPVGYKVAFAGKTAQERFGVSEPGRGTLLRDMMLESGATVKVSAAMRPLVEPDLVLRVKDRGIMSARTPLEALAHLDAVVPFIEYADLILADGGTINGANIIAINAGARFGITGQGVPVRADPAFVEAMAAMTAVFTDETGKELSRTPGSSLMGNPLNALLWLIENMRNAGLSLEAGHEISLGAMGPIMTPEAGRTYTVRYEGLPTGVPSASVTVR